MLYFKKELILLIISLPLVVVRFILPKEDFFILAKKQERLMGDEAYDYRLQYMKSLNAMNAIWEYVTYHENMIGDSSKTAEVAYQLIKDRFAFGDGYCRYTLKENWLLYLMGKFIWSDFTAKVFPDEILKHPHAACSQQSIVLISLLRSKGYPVRKIGFAYGHYALEVYYDDSWHYVDVTYEPVWDFPRCSFEELMANNMEKLVSIYRNRWSEEEVRERHLKGFWYGTPDEVPASKMAKVHVATQFISDNLLYFIWLIIVFQITRKKVYPLLSRQNLTILT